MADLVVIHSGGGHSGHMTGANVTIAAKGTRQGLERLEHALTNDTSLGVTRYADAGYDTAHTATERGKAGYLPLEG